MKSRGHADDRRQCGLPTEAPSHVRPMWVARCAVVLTGLLLAACHPTYFLAPSQVPADAPLSRSDQGELASPQYFTTEALEDRFAAERVLFDDPPQDAIGLALSGGGTKAAGYAMGVIAGLNESGTSGKKNDYILGELDYVSTVSGGGYAAYWYFSRLVDAYNQVPALLRARGSPTTDASAASFRQRVLSRCVPHRYVGILDGTVTPGEPDPCPGDARTWYEDAQPGSTARAPTGFSASTDPWRYEGHIRGYQDVLSNDFSMDPTGDAPALVADVAKGLGLTLITLPGHWFANGLFDWRLQISPTQRQYQLGIERTWGLPPVDCSAPAVDLSTSSRPHESLYVDCNAAGPRRGESNSFGSRAEAERPNPNRYIYRGLTFETLYVTRNIQASVIAAASRSPSLVGDLSESLPRVPFWIVNTTARVAGSFDLLEGGELPSFEDAVFEFTPTGYGSRLYGYWPRSHPEVDVLSAVSASAAFFDSQQRVYGQPRRFIFGSLMRVFQLNWGLDIANPRQVDRIRGRKAFLPFPFYYLYHNQGDSRAAKIHLSDGGQSDNTGIFSLVRRGVRSIVFADAAFDEDGRFGDLCFVRRQLKQQQGLHLRLVDLPEFEKECDAVTSDSDPPKSVADLWSSGFSPVQRGVISRDAGAQDCSASQGDYCAELYVLKPAVPWDALGPLARACRDSLDSTTRSSLDTEECRGKFREARDRYPRLSPELFGFLVRNAPGGNDNPPFPQNSTVKMTYNSSPWLYGAYRELGYEHASRLRLKCGTKTAPPSADPYLLSRTQTQVDCRGARLTTR